MIVPARFITQTPKAWLLELEEGKVWVSKNTAWFCHLEETLEVSKLMHGILIRKINTNAYAEAKTQSKMICDLSNYDFPKPKITTQFAKWLNDESVENQSEFPLQSLYEIYINSIIWKEIPKDLEIPKSHLKVRV